MIKKLFISVTLLGLGIYAYDIVSEINKMNFKMIQTKAMIETAVDTAVHKTISSEEFFVSDNSSTSATATSSVATRSDGGLVSNQSRYYCPVGDEWVTGNTYLLAEYYKKNGKLPQSQLEYENECKPSQFENAEHIYWYLFGGNGNNSDIASNLLSGQTLNSAEGYADTLWVYNREDGDFLFDTSLPPTVYDTATIERNPNTSFMAFYNSVGKEITTNRILREYQEDVVGTNIYKYWGYTSDIDPVTGDVIDREIEIPVLDLMGLDFKDSYTDVSLLTGTGAMTTPLALSPKKMGKTVVDDVGTEIDTEYYLTPYSLGVTYLDKSVLKVNLLTNLDTMIRLAKCKGSHNPLTTDYSIAEGCINDWTGTKYKHKEVDNMLNDGVVEYEMDTLQARINYYVVDFFDDSNYKIVNKILGSTPSIGLGSDVAEDKMEHLPSRYHKTVTGDASDGQKCNKIVAKVDVQVKLHIPFQSTYEKWFFDNDTTATTKHYDIKEWDESSGTYIPDSDGIWFYYTTYTAIV